MIRRGAHKSVQAVEADIRSWVAVWHDNPRPFIWTKTAQEILESSHNYANGSQAQDTSRSGIRSARQRAGPGS
jgi:hypothetical protein